MAITGSAFAQGLQFHESLKEEKPTKRQSGIRSAGSRASALVRASRRHPGGVCSHRGTQPRAAAGRRVYHATRSRASSKSTCLHSPTGIARSSSCHQASRMV